MTVYTVYFEWADGGVSLFSSSPTSPFLSPLPLFSFIPLLIWSPFLPCFSFLPFSLSFPLFPPFLSPILLLLSP